MSDIDNAKKHLPLPALMHRLGLGEHAKKSARCPFHDDKHKSFSVWRNGAGLWFFKCHAGCGDGDEITLLELHEHISNSEATKLFLKMAGPNGATLSAQKVTHERSNKTEQTPLDWHACREGLTNKQLEQLAAWRGYSIELCLWLKENGFVGLYDGHVAFPVHDRAGNVVAIHYRQKDGSWRYYPQGAKVRPLLIGELIRGDPIYPFESYWDAFAFTYVSGERSGIIITRHHHTRRKQWRARC